MQLRENGRDMAKTRFFSNDPASVFRTSCRRARFETDVPARRELQYSNRDPAIAAAIVLQASVVREDRMWRNERMWK